MEQALVYNASGTYSALVDPGGTTLTFGEMPETEIQSVIPGDGGETWVATTPVPACLMTSTVDRLAPAFQALGMPTPSGAGCFSSLTMTLTFASGRNNMTMQMQAYGVLSQVDQGLAPLVGFTEFRDFKHANGWQASYDYLRSEQLSVAYS